MEESILSELKKLHVLTSGEPEELGFTFEWYRHTAGGEVIESVNPLIVLPLVLISHKV